MPRIRLTQDELQTVIKMPDAPDDFYKSWDHIYHHGFIFDSFTLVSEEGHTGYDLPVVGKVPKHVYRVKVNGTGDTQTIEVKIICTMTNGQTKNWTLITTIEQWLNDITDTFHDAANTPIENWKVNKPEVDLLIPMMFMSYAVLKAMNREVIEMPDTKRRYKPVSERKTSKPKDEYKLFEVIRKYSKHINHSRHHISCESWEVKGHFRTLASGKKTYVHPYTKGKGKLKDKEYRI